MGVVDCGVGDLTWMRMDWDGLGWIGMPHPVDSRLRGNDGEGIMRIYRIGTMRCIVFTLCSQCQALGQALVLFHQGRGGFCRLCCLVSPSSPCRPLDTALKPA